MHDPILSEQGIHGPVIKTGALITNDGSRDSKREANIPDSLLKKSIKMLITKKLVKEVVNVQNRSKKLLMASDFEPSNEISGGEWYTEGKLDTEFIDKLSEACFSSIRRLKVATCEGILEWIRKAGDWLLVIGYEFQSTQLSNVS